MPASGARVGIGRDVPDGNGAMIGNDVSDETAASGRVVRSTPGPGSVVAGGSVRLVGERRQRPVTEAST
jgi:hypothetical protein